MKDEHPSVGEMWKNYLETLESGEEIEKGGYESWHFCYEKRDADELAELTAKGIKRATASLNYWYEQGEDELPQVGNHVVVTDFEGVASCVYRISSVEKVPFKDVTEEFAFAEGEGDKSLDYWRRVHRKFFTAELAGEGLEFNEELLVVCERFEVVFPLKES